MTEFKEKKFLPINLWSGFDIPSIEISIEIFYRCLQSILLVKNGHFRICPFLSMFVHFCPFCRFFFSFWDIENSIIEYEWQFWFTSTRNFFRNFQSIEHVVEGTLRTWHHYACSFRMFYEFDILYHRIFYEMVKNGQNRFSLENSGFLPILYQKALYKIDCKYL